MSQDPGWDGRGLPPAARARVDRMAERQMRVSLTGIGGLTAMRHGGLGAARLEPVGEVMGGIVEHIGWQGWGGCGVYTGFGGSPYVASAPVVTSGQGSGSYRGFKPYVDALYRGWDTALTRMLLEAQALGADGVVGVRWEWQALDAAGNREFTAIGTAIRSHSPLRPAHLFATDLAAADVGKLLTAGHAPTGLVVGISVGVRHDDWVTRSQARVWAAGNTEVTGYTELVNAVRHDARVRFHRRAGALGGDYAVVSDMGLRIWEVEPTENHRDHIAEATVIGTAIVSSPGAHTGDERTLPTTMLPLRPVSATDRRTPSARTSRPPGMSRPPRPTRGAL